VIHNGVLKNIPVGLLHDGEERDLRLTLVLTAQGQFEIAAEVRVADVSVKGGYIGGSSKLRLTSRELG